MASVSRKRTATKSPTFAKPRVFISGDLEPARWMRSSARSLSWRERLIGYDLPEYPPRELCDYPPSPINPAWRQGFDAGHAVECDRCVFLGPFAAPFGLSEDECAVWRHANMQRLETADLVFLRLAHLDDDDMRRITAELRHAAQLRIPCFVHENEATAENAILRSALRSAKKRTSESSMTVTEAFAEAIFNWREAQRTGKRSRRQRREAA